MNGTKLPVRRFASVVRDSGIRALDRKAGQFDAPGGDGGDATPHAGTAHDVYVAWAGMTAESKAQFFDEVLAAIRSVATVSPKPPRVAKSDAEPENEQPGKTKKDKKDKKNKKGKKKDKKKDKKAKKDKKKDKKKKK